MHNVNREININIDQTADRRFDNDKLIIQLFFKKWNVDQKLLDVYLDQTYKHEEEIKMNTKMNRLNLDLR
jgi:hypothetical protein